MRSKFARMLLIVLPRFPAHNSESFSQTRWLCVLQELSELGGNAELRDGFYLLERRREGIAQAPHRSRLEFFMCRRKIYLGALAVVRCSWLQD
jgi:hypothetical protein